MKECYDGGYTRCMYCGRGKCSDIFNVNWTMYCMKHQGLFERIIYNESKQDFKENAFRLQIFLKEHWNTTRDLYKTDTWTEEALVNQQNEGLQPLLPPTFASDVTVDEQSMNK